MQLQAAAASQRHLHILRDALDALLLHVVLRHQAKIGGLNKVAERHALQAEGAAGKAVDVAQADALKIRRVIDGDELCQHLVELPGKILPRRIDRCGQRKEGVCQVDLPVACGRQELIVHDRRLLLELHGARLADHLGRELFQIARIARELGADGLLKFGRLLRADGKDRRKTELTDHLDQLALAIENTLRCRKHSQDSFFVSGSTARPVFGLRRTFSADPSLRKVGHTQSMPALFKARLDEKSLAECTRQAVRYCPYFISFCAFFKLSKPMNISAEGRRCICAVLSLLYHGDSMVCKVIHKSVILESDKKL